MLLIPYDIHRLSRILKKQVILKFIPQSSLGPLVPFFSPEGPSETYKYAVSSGFLAQGSRLSKAQVVFFSQQTVTGRMTNRQHLQAAVMRWLSSLRSLCHAHKVFDQEYLKKQHQQAWSIDPNSAVCSPAMRSTVQSYLNAKVLFAWNKIKEVEV